MIQQWYKPYLPSTPQKQPPALSNLQFTLFYVHVYGIIQSSRKAKAFRHTPSVCESVVVTTDSAGILFEINIESWRDIDDCTARGVDVNMKRIIRMTVILSFLAWVFLQGGFFAVSAKDYSDLEELFQESTNADGAYTEMYSVRLGEAFLSAPTDFLEALAKQTPSVQDQILQMVVFDQGPSEAFRSAVKELTSENPLSEDANLLAEKLNNMVNPNHGETASATIPGENAPDVREENPAFPGIALGIGFVAAAVLISLVILFLMPQGRKPYQIGILAACVGILFMLIAGLLWFSYRE